MLISDIAYNRPKRQPQSLFYGIVTILRIFELGQETALVGGIVGLCMRMHTYNYIYIYITRNLLLRSSWSSSSWAIYCKLLLGCVMNKLFSHFRYHQCGPVFVVIIFTCGVF